MEYTYLLILLKQILQLYMQYIYGVETPKVGLLNIGEEEEKGKGKGLVFENPDR